MKPAIYTRVSTDDQVKGNSLTQQERAFRTETEYRGWEVVASFVDHGVSSKVRPDDRPAFGSLLVWCRDPPPQDLDRSSVTQDT